MDTPLEIRLSAPKQTYLAGEGIVLGVEQKVFSELEMEDIDLNRDRTHIYLEELSAEPPRLTVLTGSDYLKLHHQSPFLLPGQPFDAPAGSEWTNPLRLLRFTYPLAAGAYRVSLTYQYGGEEDQVVQTNPVEFEIVAAQLATVRDRWFAGGQPRYHFGSLWTTIDGHWLYQLANNMDLRALTDSVDLNMPPVDFIEPPRLAHLEDISETQFDRWAVWTEAGRLAWVKLAYVGRTSEVVAVAHGLADDPPPLLAEPPMQASSGGFSAVLVGSDPAGQVTASLIGFDGTGNIDQRPVHIVRKPPAFAVMAWLAGADFAAAVLFTAAESGVHIVRTPLGDPERYAILELPGAITALVANQFNGVGQVLAATVRDDALRVVAWDAAATGGKGAVRSYYDLRVLPPAADQVMDAVALDGGRDLALLLPGEGNWIVLAESRVFRVPKVAGAEGGPRLAAGPKGLFLVEHVPALGFVHTRVGEAPPPVGI
ncbi:MAG TPA: hypothetical protein VG456_16350 [Candidatus Sulfopaludibacter sp.]|jgi:hypothetical protein|nr:hypothetical protein [Candidatus Sulfopaludibacter sp.]